MSLRVNGKRQDVPNNCLECPNLIPKKMNGNWAEDVECLVLTVLRADCLVRGLMLLHEGEALPETEGD